MRLRSVTEGHDCAALLWLVRWIDSANISVHGTSHVATIVNKWTEALGSTGYFLTRAKMCVACKMGESWEGEAWQTSREGAPAPWRHAKVGSRE